MKQGVNEKNPLQNGLVCETFGLEWCVHGTRIGRLSLPVLNWHLRLPSVAERIRNESGFVDDPDEMQQPALNRKRSSSKPRPTLDEFAFERHQFTFERQLLQRGRRAIAGVDEAGRGPLAGPVVAAAVILPNDWIASGMPVELAELNDSKQLTYQQREEFYGRLIGSPSVRFAIASVNVETIDFLNILEAAYRAMKQALRELSPPPDHVLIDGWRVSSLRFPQTALVKGDARSFSIAAASVLAKVTRDRLMFEYDRRYPDYGFAEHKGYGTVGHLAAIAKYGVCPIHRRSFAPVRGQPNSSSSDSVQI